MGATSDDAQPADSASPNSDTNTETAAPAAVQDAGQDQEQWQVPPAQPLRLIAAVMLLAAGAASYGYALVNFWSSPALGIYLAIPYPAYLLIAAGVILSLAALRVALGLWSPHAKLALGAIAFLACLTFAIGGGRFVSYTLRGTRNPTFQLALHRGDRFPDFKLADQNNVTHDAAVFGAGPLTLVVIYRGDFCPFARFELGDLSRRREELRQAGIQVIAISADPPERSTMLARFLHTDLPLLSDSSETLLRRLGLVQHYANHQPDSAIPAYILIDRNHRVRWVFTSPWYRQLPTPQAIIEAAHQSPASAPSGAT
jgi:peroxiredoxin